MYTQKYAVYQDNPCLLHNYLPSGSYKRITRQQIPTHFPIDLHRSWMTSSCSRIGYGGLIQLTSVETPWNNIVLLHCSDKATFGEAPLSNDTPTTNFLISEERLKQRLICNGLLIVECLVNFTSDRILTTRLGDVAQVRQSILFNQPRIIHLSWFR